MNDQNRSHSRHERQDDESLERPGSEFPATRTNTKRNNDTQSHSRQSQSRLRLTMEEETKRPMKPPARKDDSLSRRKSQFNQEQVIGTKRQQSKPLMHPNFSNAPEQKFHEASLREGSIIGSIQCSIQGSTQSAESSDTDSILDLVLAKRYSNCNNYAQTSSRSHQAPPPHHRVSNTKNGSLSGPTEMSRISKKNKGMQVDNHLAKFAIRNKGVPLVIQKRHTTDECSISDTSSSVPPPPTLQQQRHFTQPGAFRMTRGKIRRSSDTNSLISASTASQRMARTRHHIIEASPIADRLPDDECPTPPPSMNYTTSMGTHDTYMTTATTTTANPVSVVEARPMDQSNTIRAFFRNRKVKFMICLLGSFCLILVLGMVYAFTGFGLDDSEGSWTLSSPTQAPTSIGDSDLNYFRTVVLPEYTRQSLRYENSAQSKALAWLKNNTLIESYSLERRIQRFSLATFFYSTGGERRWEKKDGWLSDEDECTWYSGKEGGFSVCEDSFYKFLSLGNNQLRGTFPDELSLLSSLQILELPSNILTGSMPSTLAKLTNLREIRLYDNYLSGKIPSEIGDELDQLETFDIEFNFVAQTLPNTMSQLKSLRHLLVGRNLLDGTLPSLRQMTNLEVLHLYENAFSGTFPDSVRYISSLTHINIDANFFSGRLPSDVWPKLTNLQEFTMGNNTLSGPLPVEMFQSCQNLRTLHMYQNSITGTIPSEIGLTSKLSHLFLDKNKLKGKLPTEIGKLTAINTLWLHVNELKGPIPSEIGLIGTQLNDLDLSLNNFTGSLPATLGNLDAEILFFASNELTGIIPSELGQRPSRLRRLAIEENNFIGSVPDEICELVVSGELPMQNLTVDCSVECLCCADCRVSELGV